MTSAILGIPVSDVRKLLNDLRTHQNTSHPGNPICLSDTIPSSKDILDPLIKEKKYDGKNQMSFEEFAFKFELGHHKKRHEKSKNVGKTN